MKLEIRTESTQFPRKGIHKWDYPCSVGDGIGKQRSRAVPAEEADLQGRQGELCILVINSEA